MNYSKKKRTEWVDIAKGICVSLVIIGHSNTPFVIYIYMFHVAVFFMLSGYTSNYDTKFNLKFLKNKVMTMIMPFYIINLGLYLIQFIFLVLIEPDVVSVGYVKEYFSDAVLGLFSTHMYTSDLGEASWFLISLFIVSCLFTIVLSLFSFSRIKVELSIITMLLFGLLGFYLGNHSIYLWFNFDLALMCCLPFGLGSLYRKYSLYNYVDAKTAVPISLSMLILFASFTFDKIFFDYPTRDYSTLWIYIVSSMIGFYIVYMISINLKKINLLYDVFGFIGRNSFVFFMYHFLAFKLISCFLVVCKIESVDIIRSLTPLVQYNSYYWVLYSIVSIILCATLVKLANCNNFFSMMIILKKNKRS